MSLHLLRGKWPVFIPKQIDGEANYVSLKGPNCRVSLEALGVVLPMCIHNFGFFFPKRAFHHLTASGSTNPGSVPDFSSLLIFNGKEQILRLFFFSPNHASVSTDIDRWINPKGHLGACKTQEYVDSTFSSLWASPPAPRHTQKVHGTY